jgi:protein-disulfide isomerase-like protein with CxxC motif
MSDYAGRGLAILAVNYGDKPETIAAYFEKQGFTLTAVRQKKDELSRAFGIQAYPTFYVINGEGIVSWRSAAFDEANLRSELDRVAPLK